jgi:polyisoprenoid-binding protein YceI
MLGISRRLIILLALSGGAQTAPAALDVLQIDPLRSTIEVIVHGTTGSFTGRVELFSTQIEFDSDRGRIQRAWIVLPFANLKTGRTARDIDMLKWLESSAFPEARFDLVSLERTAIGHEVANGRLTLHGVERTVSFPVYLLMAGARFSLDGEVDLDYRDYGLRVLRRFYFMTVDPNLKVRFHLQGRVGVDRETMTTAPSPSARF